jgi:branched-chain amino acid transport system substrate-binding protein
MNKTKLVVIGGMVMVLVAALVAGNACVAPVPAGGKIIKIGAPGPLSGMAAAWGLPEDRGLRMLVDKINTAGGLTVGGETYSFVVVSADTQFTVEGAAAAAHKLVDMDKVKYAIGGIDKHESLSLQAIFEPAGVIHFHDAWGDDIVKASAPHSFRIPPSPQDFTPAIFDWLKTNRPDLTRVFLTGYDTPGIRETNAESKAYMSKMGFELVGEDYFPFDSTEFYPMISRYSAADAQIVWIGGATVPQDALLAKQAKEKGFQGILLHPAPVSAEDLLALAGPGAEGFMNLMAVSDGPLATPEAKAFSQDYVQAYGKWESNVFDISAAFEILTDAMKKADSVDVEKVLSVLHGGGPFDTMFGPARISGENLYGVNCQVFMPLGLNEVKGGALTTLVVLTADKQLELLDKWIAK